MLFGQRPPEAGTAWLLNSAWQKVWFLPQGLFPQRPFSQDLSPQRLVSQEFFPVLLLFWQGLSFWIHFPVSCPAFPATSFPLALPSACRPLYLCSAPELA